MSDLDYSPWPAEGKHFWATIRKATWVDAEPFYGKYNVWDVKKFHARDFWFPYIAFRSKSFHFYIGWKPIFVGARGDPKFYWWPLVEDRGPLFVQLSCRWGSGDVS